ncbi:uncharacterized protein [Choristoneura fumiferana]|uniref:uncharacterized protein n=1 Tax=Choristoneura fumiferana TaxID=7141 RepID=UPI003D155162
MADTELKELIKKRSAIKGKVTVFRNKFYEFKNKTQILPSQVNELALRLAKFENVFNNFDTLRDRIDTLTVDSDGEQLILENVEIENDFFDLINCAQEFIESHKQRFTDAEDKSICSQLGPQINVKLPQIQLPTFDGNYSKWLEFRDTYLSIVHNNGSLNEINKFHYLRTSLEGSAAIVIKSLEISAANYAVAWKLLCDRYDNKRQLIHNHLQALFHMESLTRESDKALRHLIDHVAKNLRALESLGEQVDGWDTLIVFLGSSKLDPITLRKWEEKRNSLEALPKLTDFTDFLRSRADVLESLSRSNSHSDKSEKITQKRLGTAQKSFVASASNTTPTNLPQSCCLICKGDHRVYACNKFLEMTPEVRSNEIYKLKVCPVCFRGGHRAYQCRAIPCKICGRRHNSLLHRTYVPNNIPAGNSQGQTPSGEIHVKNACPVSLSSCIATQVLLSTAVVEIVDKETDQRHCVRALLDCGSETSFMTKSLHERLNLPSTETKPIEVTGINNMSFNALRRCKITLQARDRSIKRAVHCFVIDQIASNLPANEVDISSFEIPKNLKLADAAFYRPSQVELLLGADVFWDFIIQGQIKLGENKPVLQNSHFGWLVVGPTTCSSNNNNKGYYNKIHCNFSHEISVQLKKFWELEELPLKEKWTAEEEACEAHFIQNTYQLPNGRFCVSLPLKESPDKLGDSFNIAIKRLHQLEKRFERQPHVKQQYCDFINEYKELGHLTEIEKPDKANFLPHHPVLREKSATTRCRVVFDASSKTSSGLSLNDLLMVGPTIQEDIFSILTRFREHEYVLIGDLEKMYRQIHVNEKDRYLQVILWRETSSEPIKYLRLDTVTYGMSSSPYLSIRCLYEIAKTCDDPLIKTIIEKDMYVDDLVTGCDNSEQLTYILNSVSQTLAKAQMNLRKIKSNCIHIFKDDANFNGQTNVDFNDECSTLGLRWHPALDKLTISCSKNFSNNNDNTVKCTKRLILCTVASIFDPLGLLCVCTIKFKILLQQLWILKLEWDEDVTESIKQTWNKIVCGLSTLCTFQIDRYVLQSNSKKIELHCCSDASLMAYAACVYVRSVSDKGIAVRLLCAKAKVMPIKPAVTIPRAELLGGLLASRLYDKVRKAFRHNIDKVYFWTDSKIVLAWLNIFKTNKMKLKTFVLHRVSEITELSRGAKWNHIPSAHNPADLASRGVLPDQLTADGHFLIGRPLTSLPAPNLEEVNPNHLHRYAKMEQVRQHFWARWSQEYVAELQQRTKWRVRQPNLELGQLVLIKQAHGPPLTWPLGRITQLHKGSDGLCRVVDVRTTKGVVRRGISCICPLLNEEDAANQ